MNSKMSIEEFIQAIHKLPSNNAQKSWIRWLSTYDTPGYYNRKVNKRQNAKYAYNHIAKPEMLLWLIKAAGIGNEIVKLAKTDSNKTAEVHQKSAAVRRRVPWIVLEGHLQKILNTTTTHWLQYWKPF